MNMLTAAYIIGLGYILRDVVEAVVVHHKKNHIVDDGFSLYRFFEDHTWLSVVALTYTTLGVIHVA